MTRPNGQNRRQIPGLPYDQSRSIDPNRLWIGDPTITELGQRNPLTSPAG
jgi:hypothetical protein